MATKTKAGAKKKPGKSTGTATGKTKSAPKKNVKRAADPYADDATSKRARGKGEQLRTDPGALGLRSEPRDVEKATDSEAKSARVSPTPRKKDGGREIAADA
jgi:hypothetical protein